MVKIVEFQERAAERLEGFRSNAKALPSLVYARYLLAPTSGVANAYAAWISHCEKIGSTSCMRSTGQPVLTC